MNHFKHPMTNEKNPKPRRLPRSKKMTDRERLLCKDCHWSNINNENMECHLNAPTVLHGSGTGWSDDKWPHVLEDDYCSDFAFREQK